jgi:hypothetical protein
MMASLDTQEMAQRIRLCLIAATVIGIARLIALALPVN